MPLLEPYGPPATPPTQPAARPLPTPDPYLRQPATMRLLFVRHGKSQMNVWTEAAFNHFDGSPPDEAQLAALLDKAVADDQLTDLGREQAQALADTYAAPLHAVREAAGRDDAVQIHCSVMNRPLQTAFPLAEALGCPISVRGDLHEIGASGPQVPGMAELNAHMAAQGTDLILKTAADLRRQHRLIETSAVAQEGPVLKGGSMLAEIVDVDGTVVPEVQWNEQFDEASGMRSGPGGKMLENVAARARVVARWLRSEELQASVGDDGATQPAGGHMKCSRP